MKSITLLLLLCLQCSLLAQEVREKPEEDTRLARMLRLAKSYTVNVPESEAKVELLETSIFSWTNPQRRAIGGVLFLWTSSGRPVATIGIWTYDDVKDSHELQSLSTGPLEATNGSDFTWQPRVGGLTFKKLDHAPPPSGSDVRRLAQMRNLLRARFSAKMTRGSGEVEQLRLLPTPAYRYKPLPAKTIDGAMFSFAFDTDPEAFVILEARQDDEGPVWYYAIAPSTSAKVEAQLDGQVVWTNEDQKANGTFVFFYNP